MAIVATAEKKSVTRAGVELRLSPSGVTKRIKLAERIAKTKLFHTTEDGSILTEAGELLYSEAKKSIERALLAEEKVSAYLMLKDRHLLVGHSTYLPPRLMAILIQFRFDGTLHIGFGLTFVRESTLLPTDLVLRSSAELELHVEMAPVYQKGRQWEPISRLTNALALHYAPKRPVQSVPRQRLRKTGSTGQLSLLSD
ncbi:MAG: LysR family transcriptional regulator [Acidobacteriaceae bacterium]